MFFRDWWLDAACGPSNWDVVLSRNKAGIPVACWPYFRRTVWGIPTLDRPPFSPLCGPYLDLPAPDAGPAKRLSYYHRILAELSDALPRAVRKRAGTVPDVEYPTLLTRHGWTARQAYSYRLPTDRLPIEEVRGRYAPALRRKLKGTNEGTISFNEEPVVFEPLYAAVERRRGRFFPYSVFRRLFTAALTRAAARSWCYRTPAGEVIAAVWLPHDTRSAYLTGVAMSNSTAATTENPVARLIDHAAEWCVSENKILDLEGSRLPGVEEFYRSFGPEVATYVKLERGWR